MTVLKIEDLQAVAGGTFCAPKCAPKPVCPPKPACAPKVGSCS